MDAMDNLFLPLMLALLVAFLFLSFRNQKKRTAAMAELRAQAVPGARVQLTSGLYGTVRADDGGDDVEIEIAPGVITTWNRLAIREVVADEPHDEAVDDTLEEAIVAESGDDAPNSTDRNDSKDK